MHTNPRHRHERVQQWTMACIVLYNVLHSIQDVEAWLREDMEYEQAIVRMPEGQHVPEPTIEAKKVGVRCQTELRNLVAALVSSTIFLLLLLLLLLLLILIYLLILFINLLRIFFSTKNMMPLSCCKHILYYPSKYLTLPYIHILLETHLSYKTIML